MFDLNLLRETIGSVDRAEFAIRQAAQDSAVPEPIRLELLRHSAVLAKIVEKNLTLAIAYEGSHFVA